jgi:hypothetical protein
MWSYESAGDPKTEDVFINLTKNRELAKTLSKFADLYGYFCKYPPKNSKVIMTTVFMDKAAMIPFFNENMSSKIVDSWKIVHDPRKHAVFVRERIKNAKLKKGGQVGQVGVKDESETLDNFIDYVINLFVQKSHNLLVATIPSYADKVEKVADIGPWVAGIPQRIIENLGDNPYIGGPLMQVATDMFLEIAPKFLMVEELGVTALSVPLAPIAGLGVLTETIGLFVGEAIGMLTFALALSKGKKGAAFLNFIQLVPIFGPILRQSIVNAIQIYDKYQSEKARLAQIPILGNFIAPSPVYTQRPLAITNGGRTRTRKHRAHRKSKKVDRIRR